MACYVGDIGGYPQERFQYAVDKNFFCPICADVLKDPVQCHNQHYFCKACLTKHLENSKTCPICVEKLTEEDLGKPPRIVTDYLHGLMISCAYSERGCTEFVELGNLENHKAICCYKPVTCPNEKCGTTLNMNDLEQHMIERCEYRLVYCQECDQEMSIKRYGKHTCILSRELNEVKVMLVHVKDDVAKMAKNQSEQLNEIQRTLDSKLHELTKEVHNVTLNKEHQGEQSQHVQAMGQDIVRKNILVFGGNNKTSLNSVEMYSINKKRWVNLPPTQESRVSSTAHYHDGKVFVAGGHCHGLPIGSIECMDIRQPAIWLPFAHELPVKCHGHNSVIHNDQLWIIGGMMVKQPCSNTIHQMMLNPPYTSKFKCKLQEPLAYHGMEACGSNILILGGSTSGYHPDAVSNVSLYSSQRNRIQKVRPLPFPLMDMATVKHGNEVIIIGGRNRQNEILNSVLAYNYKTYECRTLPAMKRNRAECAAVVSGNKVYVMGGFNWESRYLNSIECLDLVNLLWEDLPPMSEAKDKISAVCVPEFVL